MKFRIKSKMIDMKIKTYYKLIWAIIAVGCISGGILIFNSEKTDPLEPKEKQPSVVTEIVEIPEISQNSEILAEAEEMLENLDLFKHPRTVNGEIRLAQPGTVKVFDSTSYKSPWVQYISDKQAAELGLSRHQVDEFQKIFNFYRKRLEQHITENSTIEVLGERHHRIKVPIMETGSEMRDAVSQELRVLFGKEKYDEFIKLNEGNLDNFFDDYGENPRTVEIQVPGEIGPFGSEIIKYIETTHFKNGVTQKSGGKLLHSKQDKGYQVYIDLIASYN